MTKIESLPLPHVVVVVLGGHATEELFAPVGEILELVVFPAELVLFERVLSRVGDAEELAGEGAFSVMHVAAQPEQDPAVVAAEAGAVEEAALRRHPLHHVHALLAKVARLAPTAAVVSSRGRHGSSGVLGVLGVLGSG